jgi:hypothetical protein
VLSQLFGRNDLFTNLFTAQMGRGKLQWGVITSRRPGVNLVTRQKPRSYFTACVSSVYLVLYYSSTYYKAVRVREGG